MIVAILWCFYRARSTVNLSCFAPASSSDHPCGFPKFAIYPRQPKRLLWDFSARLRGAKQQPKSPTQDASWLFLTRSSFTIALVKEWEPQTWVYPAAIYPQFVLCLVPGSSIPKAVSDLSDIMDA